MDPGKTGGESNRPGGASRQGCEEKSVNPAAAADAGDHGKEQGAKLKAGPRSPLQTSPYQAMAVKALIKPLIDSICFPVIPMLE